MGEVVLDQLENGHSTASGYGGSVYVPNAAGGCPALLAQVRLRTASTSRGKLDGRISSRAGSANSIPVRGRAFPNPTFAGFITNGATGATRLQLPFVQNSNGRCDRHHPPAAGRRHNATEQLAPLQQSRNPHPAGGLARRPASANAARVRSTRMMFRLALHAAGWRGRLLRHERELSDRQHQHVLRHGAESDRQLACGAPDGLCCQQHLASVRTGHAGNSVRRYVAARRIPEQRRRVDRCHARVARLRLRSRLQPAAYGSLPVRPA